MRYFLLLLFMACSLCFADIPETSCPQGNFTVYVNDVAQTPAYAKQNTAHDAAIRISQQSPRGTRVGYKGGEVNCSTAWRSVSSVVASSSRSSSVPSSAAVTSSSRSSSSVASGVTILYQNDFSNGFGAAYKSNDVVISNGAAMVAYPHITGGAVAYPYLGVDISSANTNELFIEFDARIPTSVKHGAKFLKIFGQYTSQSGHANTTFGLDYDSGAMHQTSFGDGTLDGSSVDVTENDTHRAINWDGSYPQWIGRSYGTAQVLTPQLKAFSEWGTSWHHFKIHHKFHTGTTKANEIADGRYYVEIDGLVYVDAKGLFNKFSTNGPIDRFEFFGHTQGTSSGPFEIWIDNVVVTTGGFKN